MAVSVLETIKSRANSSNTAYIAVVKLLCDDYSDLPAQSGLSGYELAQGCTAHVINENKDYMIDSSGNWHVYGGDSWTNVYTKSETDALLDDKQDELTTAQLDAVNSGITAAKLTALAGVVDEGAKNLLQLFQLGSSNANVGNPCTSQGVEYEIQSDGTITAYRKSSASAGAYIFLYKNGAVQNVSEFFDGNHIWSGNPPQYPYGGVSVWYKIGSGSNTTMPNDGLLPNANGEVVQIGFQISTALSPTKSHPIIFKPMICTAADWAVSQKFVPYCPTMAEMYEMILALQSN